ncbi:MAG: TetR/AcrR family transcriptional regulator [Lachnospiraceae bacterium]
MSKITRITKEPDKRKQEILDAAMELFATKGYEKTTITDIANHLNISQGLCYRYFKSKDEIFNIGLDQYADYFVEAYSKGLCDSTKSLKERIAASPTYYDLEKKEDVYYRFFHKQENNQFHIMLSFKICEKMTPIVSDILNKAAEKGEIILDQSPEIAASFLLYGQLGVLLDRSRSDKERIDELRIFITTLLDKFN